MAPGELESLDVRVLGGGWEAKGQRGGQAPQKGKGRSGLDLGWGGGGAQVEAAKWAVGLRPKEALILPAWVYDCISFSNSLERSLPWNEHPRR